MSIELTGTWTNSYGSKMELIEESGSIMGVYSSTTGSSGSYYLVGHCGTSATDSQGQNLVISILWRPYNSQDADGSWHWVSTFCGQLQNDGAMTLINSLLATTNFDSYRLGNYVDKLSYTKASNDITSDLSCLKSWSSADGSSSTHGNETIGGTWTGMNGDSQCTLTIRVPDMSPPSGWTTATFEIAGEQVAMQGFSDPNADQENLQSITLSGFMANESIALSLNGQWDKSLNQLVLYAWRAISTSPSDSYMQANMTSLNMTRQE